MKRFLALGAIVSLALCGCFDDSSSADDELSSSSANSPAKPPEPSSGTVSSSSVEGASSAEAVSSAEASLSVEATSSAEVASSDDQTYQLPGTSSGTLDVPKSGFIRGKCMNNSLAKAASSGESSASEKLPEAVLGYAGGEPFIEIHDVSDYCDLEAKISQKVKKDTLFVAYYDIGMASKCICTFDSHRFFIDRENASVRYFSFKEVVYKVVDLMIN